MNFLMDRSIANWSNYLAAQKAKVGVCDTAAPIIPTGNLSGRFSWTCENGRINGTVLLAPTATAQIQALDFAVAP
jgi:serine-type D-Ala-D-Ala carboxypeptidase/endopeptidase